MSIRIWVCLRSLLLLFAGLLIYMVLREDTWLNEVLAFPYESCLSKASFRFDSCVRYYLPDFIWGYALALALYAVYPPKEQKMNCIPAVLSFIAGMSYEVLQGFDYLSGTGDGMDVLFYLLAAVAAYIDILFHFKRRKKT